MSSGWWRVMKSSWRSSPASSSARRSPRGRSHVGLPLSPQEAHERDQRRAVHRRDAGAAGYFLDDKRIGADELGKKVAAILKLRPQTPVMVRGDRRANYGEVVKVMALLQGAGAESVGLLTEPEGKKR